jgi:hypothetical protein
MLLMKSRILHSGGAIVLSLTVAACSSDGDSKPITFTSRPIEKPAPKQETPEEYSERIRQEQEHIAKQMALRKSIHGLDLNYKTQLETPAFEKSEALVFFKETRCSRYMKKLAEAPKGPQNLYDLFIAEYGEIKVKTLCDAKTNLILIPGKMIVSLDEEYRVIAPDKVDEIQINLAPNNTIIGFSFKDLYGGDERKFTAYIENGRRITYKAKHDRGFIGLDRYSHEATINSFDEKLSYSYSLDENSQPRHHLKFEENNKVVTVSQVFHEGRRGYFGRPDEPSKHACYVTYERHETDRFDEECFPN